MSVIYAIYELGGNVYSIGWIQLYEGYFKNNSFLEQVILNEPKSHITHITHNKKGEIYMICVRTFMCLKFGLLCWLRPNGEFITCVERPPFMEISHQIHMNKVFLLSFFS